MSEQNANERFKTSIMEGDLITTYRLLQPEGQALAYRYLHSLATKQVAESDPELRIGQNIGFAVHNSESIHNLCPYIPVSSASNMYVVISPEYDMGEVYELAEMKLRLLYRTTNYNEVVEILETALSAFEEKGQDEFAGFQNAFRMMKQK